MEVDKLIDQVKKINLPIEEYAVFGSAVMAIRNLREAPNIDLIVTNVLWDKLIETYTPDSEGFIHINNVKISNWWFAPTCKDISTMIKESEIINGLPFVRIEDVLFYKKNLKTEKDKNDVMLIERFLKESESELPFNLGYSSYEKFLKTFVCKVNEQLGKSVISMVLFGSVTRNQAKGDSDIDIFVFYDDEIISRQNLNEAFNKIILELRMNKDYFELVSKNIEPEVYPFYINKKKGDNLLWVFLDCIEDGIILKDTNNYARNLIVNFKKMLEKNGGRRIKLANGTWCWSLFNNYKLINKNLNF